MKTESLIAKGFTKVNEGPGGSAWVRIGKKGNFVLGTAVIVTPGFAFSISAAACMATATMEALGAAAENPPTVGYNVGGSLLKKLGRRFRKRINKAARKIAKMKVLNQLRGAYIKVIKGPIGDLGIAAGARALSAFGVPAAATRVALTQRRNAQADRLAHGGWAGMVATATEDGGAKKLAQQIFERNKRAAIDALPAALPGGLLLNAAKGAAGALGRVSSGYDPHSARDTYWLGLHA